MKMDQNDIDELIGKFKASGLGAMEYEEDGFRFRIEKDPAVVFAGAGAGFNAGAAGAGAVSGNFVVADAAGQANGMNAAGQAAGAGTNGAADANGAGMNGAGAGMNGAGAGMNGAGAGMNAAAETIDSPIVGVFYQAPAPGEEPFVKEGDRVSKGDVVCVVEAMKVMNEIRASYDCRITKVLAADGGMVEFGSALFEVERV